MAVAAAKLDPSPAPENLGGSPDDEGELDMLKDFGFKDQVVDDFPQDEDEDMGGIQNIIMGMEGLEGSG